MFALVGLSSVGAVCMDVEFGSLAPCAETLSAFVPIMMRSSAWFCFLV